MLLVLGQGRCRELARAGRCHHPISTAQSGHQPRGVEDGWPVAPYAGASYRTFENRMLYPFGVNVAIGSQASAMLINDGVHTHVSATYAWSRFAATLLAVERKDMGVTVGVRF